MGRLVSERAARGVRFALALCAGLALCALPATASAQRVPQTEGNRNLARQLFLRGDTAYREGRYEASIELFREAYRLSARPLLLFNIANAHERLGHLREAASALEQYLPNAGAETADIRRRITALSERAEQERRAAEALSAERERLARVTRENEAAALERARSQQQASSATESRPFPARGLVIASVGVAGLAVGAAFGVLALGANGSANALCATVNDRRLCTVEAREPLAVASRDALIADISFGVGGALTGAGIILLAIDLARRGRAEEHTASVVGASSATRTRTREPPVQVGAGVGSLTLAWRFR